MGGPALGHFVHRYGYWKLEKIRFVNDVEINIDWLFTLVEQEVG